MTMKHFVLIFILLTPSCFAQSTTAEAEAAYLARDYRAALELYRQVSRPDERQRGMMVRSLQALGRSQEAYQEFFMLCRVASFPDRLSEHFDCIPLVWFSSRPFTPVGVTPEERLALDWLSPTTNPSGSDNPTASLLAASILLSSAQGTHRSSAMERLEQLSFPGNATDTTRRQIALLAQMQLRRVQIAALKEESELALWHTTVENLPDSLRAGPYYLLGLAYAKLQNDEQAVLCWMRVPILFPENRPLAAQSLQEAAKALRRLGREKEEQTLLDELKRVGRE